ncbi:AAA family ATPase [Pseudoroseicyclus tamaricis]|uniref:AAA family ATPase n=1 Tax=Pseudoroseicyclus tamaricis TaxID=2705421 RepID=A0A6B2JP34_9RHOB|nr:AAA family ATPase [Pseudoroseicyclus tamaricis]NDU99817.1 AAA family ATPase [Pseudoroseicyclus tamaricis]
MRLRRLDLARYGRFEGTSLDFGSAREGPDVTVIFGPNEAGKSTAFAAWLDLLYGLQRQGHPYAFRFERKDLLVGAEVETAEGSLVLQRTARNTGSLTDGSGREVADHRLASLLHGLDRNAYRTRFSLDDAVLRAGGEEIAAAKGDLGRLLHAGTSGLSGLSRALDEVREDVERFYKKGGSAQVLPAAKRRLKELEAEMRERRLSPTRFDALRTTATAREAAAQEARNAVAEARRAIAYADAAARRRELRARQAELANALEGYPTGPALAQGVAHEVVRIAAEAREAAERERRANEDYAEAARLLSEELTPDPEGVDLGPLLDDLDGLRFDDHPLLLRVAGAEADLEKRHADRDRLAASADDLASRLGGEGAEAREMRLAPATLDLLSSQLQEVRDAENDLRGAREALADAEEGQGEAPAVPRGEAALAEAWERMRAEAPDLDALHEAEAEAVAATGLAAASLPIGWEARLSAEGLASEEEVSAMVQAAARTADAQAVAEEQCDDAIAAREGAEARYAAAAANPAAMGIAEVQRRRLAREQAWSTHRAALDAETAESFEAAMRADDEATAAHAEGAEARALLLRRSEELETARAGEVAAKRSVATARTECGAVSDRLAVLAPRLLLNPGTPPDSLLPRRRALVLALEAGARQRAATTARERAEDRLAALERGLREALETSGVSRDDTPLGVAAKMRLAELREAGTALARWQAREEQRAGLVRQVTRAQERLAARKADLADMAEESWAGQMAPAALREALPVAADLARTLDQLRDLDHRIARMEQALETFEAVAPRIREVVGRAATAEALVRAARQRRTQAERIAAEIAAAARRRDDAADTAREARVAQEQAAERIAELLAGQQVPEGVPPDHLVTRFEERDGLRREQERTEAEISQAGRDLDSMRLAEEEADLDPARRAGLADDLTRAEDASAAADREAGAAQQELASALKAGGGAEADQERAAILEELAGGAREAIVRAIGAAAARTALRRLGESRRGPMLADTEAAFRRLTGGVWSRLDTWVQGQDERLVGISEGLSVPADCMSTGTRAQLYLALRVAGHAAFVRDAGPLPFVTDDILESFDDQRAAAALDLTAELGSRGQAILFTHHAHLVEMARARISGVRVIELPGRNVTAA